MTTQPIGILVKSKTKNWLLVLVSFGFSSVWWTLAVQTTRFQFRFPVFSIVTIIVILGAFAKLRKATISFVMCQFAWNNSAPTGRVFMKFDIWELFEKSFENIQVSLKYDKNNGTLHKDLCTFMIISHWILRRMRNVSDRSCRENQNTHFMINNFSQKSCRLWDNVKKNRTYCCDSTATMIRRTLHNVTLYLNCLSYLIPPVDVIWR